jgi:DNA helicase MCM9
VTNHQDSFDLFDNFFFFSSLYLLSAAPRLLNSLFSKSRKIHSVLDSAAAIALDEIFREQATRISLEGAIPSKNYNTRRTKTVVRVVLDLERFSCPGLSPTPTQVSARHVGRVLSLSGTVLRLGGVKTHEVEFLAECTRCRHRFRVAADDEYTANAEMPSVCPSVISLESKKCTGTSFCKVSANTPVIRDYQEMLICDSAVHSATAAGASWLPASLARSSKKTAVGEIFGSKSSSVSDKSRSLLIILEDGMVDKCHPGDDVSITLTVHSRWNMCHSKQRMQLVLVCRATSIQLFEKRRFVQRKVKITDMAAFTDFWKTYDITATSTSTGNLMKPAKLRALQGRDVILRSVCPQLFGLVSTKLACLLAIIGGVSRVDSSSTANIRGESHLLIVGDSGTGKSQLLRYIAQAAPRAIITSGMSSTAAGLTVSIANADSRANCSIEAGALALADGGLCCIDEFGFIRPGELTAIHEAMEQQTLSFAKGRVVATLQTRCAVVGACNTKGFAHSLSASLVTSTSFSQPLLSRFDCVMILSDDRNEDADRLLSTHMISLHSTGTSNEQIGKRNLQTETVLKTAKLKLDLFTAEPSSSEHESIRHDSEDIKDDTEARSTRPKLWPLDRIRSYIALVRSNIDPAISTEAEALLRGYYQMQRRKKENISGHPTIRLLESLIRLTQAHARLLWMDMATERDVVVAVSLVENSFSQPLTSKSAQDPTLYFRGFVSDQETHQQKLQLLQRISEELGPTW